MESIRSYSHSAMGASHIKNMLPCQDASLNYSPSEDALMGIAIVADGHGSPQYFRSDIGSRIATDVALDGVKAFIAQNPDVPEEFANGDGKKVLDHLVRYVISSWFTRVSDDETASPLIDDERMADIDDKYKKRYFVDPDHQAFCHAYGTTLIVAAVTENYWFGFHIGDGKCVALYEDGTWAQPIPWDDNCFLNTTTSICDDGSINKFRYWFGFRQADGSYTEYRYGIDGQDKDEIITSPCRPVAIFIGSDGVDDTYPIHENEKHMERLYRSIVLSFAANGFDNTNEQLYELAKKLAEQGSQDDVSMAGLVCDFQPEGELIEKLKIQAAE